MNVPYLVVALVVGLMIVALLPVLARAINRSERAGDGNAEWLRHTRWVIVVLGAVLVVLFAIDAIRR